MLLQTLKRLNTNRQILSAARRYAVDRRRRDNMLPLADPVMRLRLLSDDAIAGRKLLDAVATMGDD